MSSIKHAQHVPGLCGTRAVFRPVEMAKGRGERERCRGRWGCISVCAVWLFDWLLGCCVVYVYFVVLGWCCTGGGISWWSCGHESILNCYRVWGLLRGMEEQFVLMAVVSVDYTVRIENSSMITQYLRSTQHWQFWFHMLMFSYIYSHDRE